MPCRLNPSVRIPQPFNLGYHPKGALYEPLRWRLLRKRVGAIIERRQRSAIVIASHDNGTGLPTHCGLPPLGRRDSPHDYNVRFLRVVCEAIRSQGFASRPILTTPWR